jgi:HD-like signal output (HDOD) protein
MFANPSNHKARLTVAPQQTLVEMPRSWTLPLPGEGKFPSPPAMPNALLRLDLWLSEFVADLQDITKIILSDLGLTAQLLRLAACEIEESPGRSVALNEIVVLVGVEKLRALVAATQSLPGHGRSHASSQECEQFWTHARLTGLVAQELALRSCEVSGEEAYVAGLLCNLGELPSLLGWELKDSEQLTSRQIGRRMAQTWGFPRDLVDVIGGDYDACRTHESCALLEIVTDADNWASRLEFLAARESESLRVKSPAYRRWPG